MNKIYRVLFLFIILIISGCTSTAPYSISSDISKNELATIHVYRTDVAFHSLNPEKPFFYLDGKSIGKLGTGQSLTIDVPSGEHNISIKASFFFMPSYEKDRIKFKVEPNNEYYIRYSKEMSSIIMGAVPTVTSRTSLQIVDRKHYLEKK